MLTSRRSFCPCLPKASLASFFLSCISNILSSMLFWAINLTILTFSFCPYRWTQFIACSSSAEFHHGSKQLWGLCRILKSWDWQAEPCLVLQIQIPWLFRLVLFHPLMHPTATYWCQHLSAALPEHLIEQWKNYWFTAWVYNIVWCFEIKE